MRKETIKRVLFSLASVATFSAHATEPSESLRLIEELPLEQRLIAHDAVLKYLNQHPEAAADAKIIAIDEKGTVYVLDENLAIVSRVGNPSCGGGCMRAFD